MPHPADDGFYMPGEWAPHARCWMEWPCRAELWGERLEAAQAAYAEVADAILSHALTLRATQPQRVSR